MTQFNRLWSREIHEKWRKDRAGGMARYVMTRGILGWGLVMLVVMHFAIHDHSPWLHQAALWLGGGLLYGSVIWFIKEKIFLKIESEKESKETV